VKVAGIGDLKTADPLDPAVVRWWKAKADEIYQLIPDFGGFLVKAGSEGMAGPKHYSRTHAETANMLAAALAPHGGILMWRAFVYDPAVDADRSKRAYKEFVPLDGMFATNVFVQVKSGPLDFQPREPFHPLLGAMPKTPLMMELEVKQEYLGNATDLVYEGEQWQELLQSDTYAQGKGSTVARVVDGSLHGYAMTGIAGVANIGTDRNWCGHPFAQANWHAFGRLAWNPYLKADAIAEEWVRMTWGNSPTVVSTILAMMKGSWQAAIDARTPLGLNFLCGGDHRDPDLKIRINDYFTADTNGIGYNRTDHAERGWFAPSGLSDGHPGKVHERAPATEDGWKRPGTDAVGQYREPLRTAFNGLDRCPEDYLLWFHFVPWDHKMRSGRSLWEELCFRYDRGLQRTSALAQRWRRLEGQVDAGRFAEVSDKLIEQEALARKWRDACVNFFARESGRATPGAVQTEAKAEEASSK
jgi:alpha-glucuronidase